MNSVQLVLSNREIANLIWILFLIIFFYFTTKEFRDIVETIFSSHILNVILLAFIYSIGLIFLLRYISFWDKSMVKDTVFWFFGSALLMLFNYAQEKRRDNYFKNAFGDTLKLILILEFLMNIYSFSFVVEFLLLPFLVTISMLKIVSENNQQQLGVRIFESILAVVGLIFLGMTIKAIANDSNNFFSYTTLKTFFLPILLTLLFIPFIYSVALYIKYEAVFGQLDRFIKEKKNRNYAKFRVLLKGNISLAGLTTINQKAYWLTDTKCTREDIKNTIS